MSTDQKAAELAEVAHKFIYAHLNSSVSSTLRVLIERLKKLNVEMSVLRERWSEHFSADNSLLTGLQKQVDDGPKAIKGWMLENAEVLEKMKTEIDGADGTLSSEQSSYGSDLDKGMEELFEQVSKFLGEMGTELNAMRTVMKSEAHQFANTLNSVREGIELINKTN